MLFEMDRLNKHYGQNHALKDFSLRMEPGIYALLGPTGAGKSTLMNIIVQNLRADSGHIRVDEVPMEKLGKGYRARLGYMPQQQELPGYFSASRFLYYIAALKGMDRSSADEQIEQALKLVNMWEWRDQKLSTYSGGMKQRILIAQAILGDPGMLIMDEPTAGLDPKERIRIRNLIAKISEHRITLIATHVVSDIECIAGELLFLRKGCLIEHISPAELQERMQGKVFELLAPADRMDLYLSSFQVSSLTQESGGIRVRLLSDTPLPAPAVPVTPHLEDLYLYLFGKDA